MNNGTSSWSAAATRAFVYAAIVGVLAVFYQGCGGSFQPSGAMSPGGAAGKSGGGANGQDAPISYALIVQDAASGLTMPPGTPLEAGSPYLITLIAPELGDERLTWSLANGSACGMFQYGSSGRAQQIICSQGGDVTASVSIARQFGAVDRASVVLSFGSP